MNFIVVLYHRETHLGLCTTVQSSLGKQKPKFISVGLSPLEVKRCKTYINVLKLDSQ
jgi:hypothetical protein